MKLLVKMPTRSRGHKFVSILKSYIDTCDDLENTRFLVSYDLDDQTMTSEVVSECISLTKTPIVMVGGYSKNKIDACNRDVNDYGKDWDVILLASDDMVPQCKGWDTIVRRAMSRHFNDTDGALWFNDGHQDRICTFSIMGKKYYDRFGYIYHPDYTSLWCDNEFTDVGLRLEKLVKYPLVLFYHNHPMWTGNRSLNDALYDKNESYYKLDKLVYERRKAKDFA